MKRVEVKPATLATASFVMANMNPDDRAEVMCQVKPGQKTHELAYFLLQSPEAWIATWQGQPACFFGCDVMNIVALQAWAVGTKHSWRCFPAITAFFAHDILKRRIAEGFRIMEARSITSHVIAHKWMQEAGAERIGGAFTYGREGEQFYLFRWTAERYGVTTRQIREPRT